MVKNRCGLKSLIGKYVSVEVRDTCPDRGEAYPRQVCGVVRDVSESMLCVELDQETNPGDTQSAWINLRCPHLIAVDVPFQGGRTK